MVDPQIVLLGEDSGVDVKSAPRLSPGSRRGLPGTKWRSESRHFLGGDFDGLAGAHLNDAVQRVPDDRAESIQIHFVAKEAEKHQHQGGPGPVLFEKQDDLLIWKAATAGSRSPSEARRDKASQLWQRLVGAMDRRARTPAVTKTRPIYNSTLSAGIRESRARWIHLTHCAQVVAPLPTARMSPSSPM
jgi:hypothetical protein